MRSKKFVTKVPLVAKKYWIWELRAKRKVLFKAMKNKVSDQIQLDEVSVQSKEIRADISQLRQEVKELIKLLKSQTS